MRPQSHEPRPLAAATGETSGCAELLAAGCSGAGGGGKLRLLAGLDVALGSLVCWLATLHTAGGWNYMSIAILSNPGHSMILSFCDLFHTSVFLNAVTVGCYHLCFVPSPLAELRITRCWQQPVSLCIYNIHIFTTALMCEDCNQQLSDECEEVSGLSGRAGV